jgi:hypothetical protein
MYVTRIVVVGGDERRSLIFMTTTTTRGRMMEDWHASFLMMARHLGNKTRRRREE